MLLTEKNILVTGSARRIGAEIVRQLANKGAHVIIHCNQSLPEAMQLLTTLPGKGHQIIQTDLSIPGEAQKLFDNSPALDAIINNASLYRHCGIYDEKTAKELWEINYTSPLTLMKNFVNTPPENGGCVINILDQEILSDRPQTGAYLESRIALKDATLKFAKEYGSLNLRFNAVCPGPMLPPAELPESKMEKTIATLPLQRRVEPEDLAKAVIFLLECDSITGAVLPVDCGQHL
jgi:NAD(P)-dependent dehydrogenase (short-subunit alcohol dehydrogenase family)